MLHFKISLFSEDCLNDEEQNDSMSVDDPDGERNNNSSRSNCRLHCVSGSFYNLEAGTFPLHPLMVHSYIFIFLMVHQLMNSVYIFAILEISETEAHVFKAAQSSR